MFLTESVVTYVPWPSLSISGGKNVSFPPGIKSASFTWDFSSCFQKKMGGQSALLGSAVFQVPWFKIDNSYAQVIYFQVEYSATFQC